MSCDVNVVDLPDHAVFIGACATSSYLSFGFEVFLNCMWSEACLWIYISLYVIIFCVLLYLLDVMYCRIVVVQNNSENRTQMCVRPVFLNVPHMAEH
jgi:hypothetical protein